MRSFQLKSLAVFSGLALAAVAGGAAKADAPGYYLPPKFRHQVPPVYSDAARALHETGTVQAKVLVSMDGKGKTFTIFRSSGHKDLDNAVLAAVRASTYSPATSAGKPITAFYDVTYRFTLAGLAQNVGSEGDLGKRLSSNRNDINTRIELATIYINKKNYAQAESILQAGARTNPRNAKVLARLGIAYFQDAAQSNDDAKYKQAADMFDRALAIDPHAETAGTAAAAYGHYAFNLLHAGQPDQALPYARKAADLNPKLMDYKLVLGEVEEAMQNYQAALTDLQAARALDDHKSAMKSAIVTTDIGVSQLSMGNDAEGLASINQAEQLDGHNPQPYQALYGYYLRKGNLAAALTPLKQLSQLQPNNAQVQVSLGEIYVRQGNLTAAKAAFEKAVSIDPQSGSAQFGMAELAAGQGQVGAADEALRKAIAASPKDAAMYQTQLASLLLGSTTDKADHSADAVRYAQAATVADPNNSVAWYDLGVAYAYQKKKDDSNNALRKAYALDKAKNDKSAMDAVKEAYKKFNGSDLTD
ncbi:MAG: TonB family protein [Candidatus Eremiobacteraeota bacterium]|nr:TonB family protein [Candidatus Eremiobacteraeota bacterium]